MKYGLIFVSMLLSTGQTFGQIKSADLTGVWIFKKSSTISVVGGQVLKDKGLHMVDTLWFNADGRFIFILTPQKGSFEKRTVSGDWKVDDEDLILYNRRNQVGQQLPKENLSMKMKGSKKLRIYFKIGGMASEHYEQYARLKNSS